MNSILVTGSTGLLGSSLVPYLRSSGLDLIAHGNSQKADVMFDLTSKNETTKYLDIINPTIIINLVGNTNVEECEKNINKAYLINTKTVENLSTWIQATRQCHLVHISTDHVYDGKDLNLEDHINLKNTYALTKYAAEIAATRVPCSILRTNFVGKSKSPNRKSLSDWVYTSLKEKKMVEALSDVYFSPLSLMTLCIIIGKILKIKPQGIFNLGSHNGMSKADFNFRLAESLGLQTRTMKKICLSDCNIFHAVRPRDMRMDCRRIETVLGIKLPKLDDEIILIGKEYNE